MIVDMPICEHRIPFKNECKSCGRDGKKYVPGITNFVHKLDKRVDVLEDKISKIEILFSSVIRLERLATEVLDLLVKKAHDLKENDKKRDDVINVLNQKISFIDQKVARIKENQDAYTR